MAGQTGDEPGPIEDHQGRKRGSEHTARYMARFGKEPNERTYARLHGKDVKVEESEPDEIGPVDCPRCDRKTPGNRDRCMWCHFALSPNAAREAKAKREVAFEAIARPWSCGVSATHVDI